MVHEVAGKGAGLSVNTSEEVDKKPKDMEMITVKVLDENHLKVNSHSLHLHRRNYGFTSKDAK